MQYLYVQSLAYTIHFHTTKNMYNPFGADGDPRRLDTTAPKKCIGSEDANEVGVLLVYGVRISTKLRKAFRQTAYRCEYKLQQQEL
jgi:hypothetical protein